MEKELEHRYLECERMGIFLILMMGGGFMGAYTYLLKGGVFCNAQTSNIMLLGVAIGQQNWRRAGQINFHCSMIRKRRGASPVRSQIWENISERMDFAERRM